MTARDALALVNLLAPMQPLPPQPAPPLPSVEAIVKLVASEFKVTVEDIILSRARWQPLGDARSVAMVLCVDHGGLSSVKVGKLFKRNGSTVRYAMQSISDRENTDKKFRERISRLRKALKP